MIPSLRVGAQSGARPTPSGWRTDIGAPHATDQAIVDRVDDITALMLGALGRAMAERRHTWLLHYSWFVDLINELADDAPDKPLDA